MMDLLDQSKQDSPMEWHIIRSMDELSRELRFDELKIQDICEVAAISKPTFYRYFKNKQDALRWHMKGIGSVGANQIGRSCGWYDGILVTLLAMLELKNLYSSFEYIDSNNPFGGHTFTGELFFQSMVQTLTGLKRLPLTDLLEFQIRAVADIFSGAFERYRASGMKDPAHYAFLCETLIPKPLYDIMDE